MFKWKCRPPASGYINFDLLLLGATLCGLAPALSSRDRRFSTRPLKRQFPGDTTRYGLLQRPLNKGTKVLPCQPPANHALGTAHTQPGTSQEARAGASYSDIVRQPPRPPSPHSHRTWSPNRTWGYDARSTLSMPIDIPIPYPGLGSRRPANHRSRLELRASRLLVLICQLHAREMRHMGPVRESPGPSHQSIGSFNPPITRHPHSHSEPR